MEWHVDTGERDSGEATVELEVPALGLLSFEGLGIALLDDVGKHFFDLVDGEGLGQLIQENQQLEAMGKYEDLPWQSRSS
jgi:hypothetical protein